MRDRTETAQIPEIADINMPIIDLVAALAQEIADHVLARPFGAAGGWDRDKILRCRKLRVEAGIDGIENSLAGIAGVHRAVISLGSSVHQIKAYFAGACRERIAF